MDDDNEDETMWYQKWGLMVIAIKLGVWRLNISKIYLIKRSPNATKCRDVNVGLLKVVEI